MSCDLTLDAIPRKTVGSISNELIVKTPDTFSPIEQMRESLTDYDKNIYECMTNALVQIPSDFYIVVITKKEPLMPNVIRNYFGSRISCPTPDYDQTVYKYVRKDEEIKFMWVIPSKHTCINMINHKTEVPPEDWLL